jgi:hypothetical protein
LFGVETLPIEILSDLRGDSVGAVLFRNILVGVSRVDCSVTGAVAFRSVVLTVDFVAFVVSGTLLSCCAIEGAGAPPVGDPNENPKSTACILRVLFKSTFHQLLWVKKSRAGRNIPSTALAHLQTLLSVCNNEN